MERREFTVPAEDEGQRLDKFLVSVLEGQSRSQVQKLIDEGCAALHRGSSTPAVRANLPVRDGDIVVVSLPAVLDDPRALAVARAADLVVVSIERGRTAHEDARRTVELVGRARVAGCVLVG